MPFPIAGAIGGMLLTRLGYAGAYGGRHFLRSPIMQGGQFGFGYTSFSYLGYGASNTLDPFSIHNKSSNTRPASLSFKMPYGSYGRRRYSRYSRYGRRSRYSGYTRYSRYSRRRRYRRTYRRYSRFY